MHRIDAAFAHPLNEKNDPKERFEQALDEFDIHGNLRLLLIKHFSDNWQNVFRGVSELEEALSQTKQSNSESENCIAFLLTQKTTLSNSILRHFDMFKLPVNDSSVIAFLKDVAKAYYPNSPYGLFNDGLSNIEGHYFLFVSWLYGKNFCFSKEFFDDQSLNSLSKSERTSVLWSHFNAMAHQFRSREDSILTKELIYIVSSNSLQGPPSKDSLDMMRGLDFIKAWLKFDSQGGRLSYNWIDFFYDYGSPWEQLETLIRYERSDCEETSKLLIKWLEATKLEFEKLIYVNADLNLMSAEGQEQWVKGIESYYISYTNDFIYCDYEYSQSTNDDLKIRLSNAHHDLCSELNPMQISTWIKYSVDCDFQRVIDSKQTRSDLLNSAEKWVSTEYFIAWKKIFLKKLNLLNIEDQLTVLSCSPPYTEGYYLDKFRWWNELFSNLIHLDSFPNNLVPSWTFNALHSSNNDKALPFVDKSIGILRGELSKSNLTSDEAKEYHTHLNRLLPASDKISTRKGIRHRLMLQRFSTIPYSNEELSMFSGSLYKGNFYDWYTPFNNLARGWFCNSLNNDKEKQTSYEDFEKDFYTAFACELSEFFLSRLRLRKKEKAKDGQYEAHQVIESSAIWRQGYLKALSELGFDLGGQVHKTVNFIKKADPEKVVRDIAGECYKAVRRHSKQNPTIEDIKRGIVAAEWWLLMCQRHELGLKVDDKKALKTRRNLMRNP